MRARSRDEYVHLLDARGSAPSWSPPAGKTVIAEVYPSIFRNRYDEQGRTADAHDAYVVARWLAESAARGSLERYLNPPLTLEERRVAEREGWILGVG